MGSSREICFACGGATLDLWAYDPGPGIVKGVLIPPFCSIAPDPYLLPRTQAEPEGEGGGYLNLDYVERYADKALAFSDTLGIARPQLWLDLEWPQYGRSPGNYAWFASYTDYITRTRPGSGVNFMGPYSYYLGSLGRTGEYFYPVKPSDKAPGVGYTTPGANLDTFTQYEEPFVGPRPVRPVVAYRYVSASNVLFGQPLLAEDTNNNLIMMTRFGGLCLWDNFADTTQAAAAAAYAQQLLANDPS